jgi:hypothetical protein
MQRILLAVRTLLLKKKKITFYSITITLHPNASTAVMPPTSLPRTILGSGHVPARDYASFPPSILEDQMLYFIQ